MKTYFASFGLLTTILIGASLFFTSCDKDDHVVRYVGKVVYAHTTDPFADCLVQITDGTNIHCMGTTNELGSFVLSVRVAEINGNYYFHAGDKTCVPFETNLFGYGRDEVNLGTIEVEGPTLPTVTTKLGAISVNTAISGGEVTSDGRLSVTARGVCWSKSEFPTLEEEHTTNGEGKGDFQSKLSDLQANTTYYVRAYATNALGTAYGNQIQFTTKDGLPVVTTGAATVTASSITATGEITANGGYNVTARGFCYSKTNSEPTITDAKVTSGSGNGTFSASISNLTPATTYYVRAYATNSIGTAYGQVKTVTTSNGEATVTLGAITEITALTASGSVTVTNAGGATLQSCGICWSTNSNPTISDKKVIASGNQLNTAYTCNMSALQPNTTYYVRAYATTNVTTAYSSQRTFTTATGLPIVTTNNTTATSTTISSGGTIRSDGGYNITARGVCYSTTNSTPTISDKYTTAGIGKGSFSTTITDVSINTTYYVRAYATNSIGTAYGAVMTITTGNGLPSVTTTNIGENVTSTTAKSGGQVTDDGGYSVIARGVCWSTLPYPTIADNKTTDGNGTGYYSSTITGIDLTSSNTYYVRAYATNINGTAYGTQVLVNKENLDYKDLPYVNYGGYVYKIYPDIGAMTWSQANNTCHNLVYSGYNDWILPPIDVLIHIMTNITYGWKLSNGGTFVYYSPNYPSNNSSSVKASAYYWSDNQNLVGYYSTDASNWWPDCYNCTYWNIIKKTTVDGTNSYRVRPVRKYKANQ